MPAVIIQLGKSFRIMGSTALNKNNGAVLKFNHNLATVHPNCKTSLNVDRKLKITDTWSAEHPDDLF